MVTEVRQATEVQPVAEHTPYLSNLAAMAAPNATSDGCVDFGIRITPDGTWFHNGLPFTRMALVKLFSTAMRRAPNGDYLLQTAVEKGRITVEDVPFRAVEMTAAGKGRDRRLWLRTNIDEWVEVGPSHPIWLTENTAPASGGPTPYLIVTPGIEARIERAVFYDLVELGEDREMHFGVWAGGVFHPLGPSQIEKDDSDEALQ